MKQSRNLYWFKNGCISGPDPFDLLFPKMTKCTMFTYGPSGTAQNHDGLCVMPVNVINEKVF